MTEAEQLRALADRCEAASGPDREVDDAIADAILTGKHRTCIKGLSDEAGGMWMFRYPDGSIGSSLRFTASLDAAMTLVPNDCGFVLHNPVGKRPSVALQFGDEDFPAPKTVDGWGDYSSGATPALALCAAALRALA